MNLIFSKYSVFFIFFAFFAFPLSGQANDSVVVTFTGILLAKVVTLLPEVKISR